MADLLFGQQHATTGPWLVERYGQAHTIGVADFPHTRALLGDHDTYLDYLKTSWAYYGWENTETTRRARLARLLTAPPGPVTVVTRPDGGRLIVDGNHRAAVAHVQGVEPDIIEVPAVDWLAKVTANKGLRYGTRPGLPYQSVFWDGREIVEGRRRDTLTRHEAIGETNVLDLGCNIGAATILAGGHGVDSSSRLVTSAWRLAAFCASPATFEVADLNAVSFKAETVFCFAVVAHLTKLGALRKTLARASTVYFEENTGPAQLPHVADLFADIVRIPGGDRPLYRCRT